MSIFEKIANNHATIKRASIDKEAFIGAIMKSIGGAAFRNPLRTAGMAADAHEAKSRTSDANKVVNDAKNRNHLRNTLQRV